MIKYIEICILIHGDIMNNKKVLIPIILSVVGILVIICIFAFLNNNANLVTDNTSQMVEQAKSLYQEGDKDTAIYQLKIYCDEKPDNTDGFMLLGDWYMADGDTTKAYENYKTAAVNMGFTENQLAEAHKVDSLQSKSDNITIKIYPNAKYTKNMTLTFSGENITPKESVSGAVNGTASNLKADENCLTTPWFTVDSAQKNILLTGNINCAVWQFMDLNNNIESITDQGPFKNYTNVRFNNKSYSTVEIPDGAVKARVTYFNKAITDTVQSGEQIYIGYGKALEGYTNTQTVTINIPDLTENQYISYSQGKWQLVDGENVQTLDWEKLNLPKGSFYSIDGDLCGVVEITYAEETEKKVDKSLQYGVKYSTTTGVAVCERLGAARGMNFNYTIGDQWANNGENDFDKAYPWCEMKLCNVKVDDYGEKTVTMQGEKGYKEDGSNGNVMVQIPKFYSKRVVKDGYEQIWISGKKHSGYELDPVFLGDYGEELDYVYMSAYLGAEKDDKIVSAKNTYPTLLLNYGDTLEKAENNGDGFSEMSYSMCSALQRLFVVETGTIDSSSLFAGDTFMYYFYDERENTDSGLAALDAEKTNTITLYNNFGTEKIAVGSSITIFEGWDTYKNNNGSQRVVTEIVEAGDYLEVTFDGKPVNIKKDKTAISNIPAKTGKTSDMEYCTGTLEGEEGKVSFKYRNIENLYGSALIMLDDDAYMQDGTFYFEDTYGSVNSLDAKVAEQPEDLSNYNDANLDYCIKEMTYDKDNPFVMLPAKIGNGSSSHNYYGDFWMYQNKNDGNKRYFLYGGADDNSRLAGLFHLRAAIADEDVAFSFYSARIMCK